MEINFK